MKKSFSKFVAVALAGACITGCYAIDAFAANTVVNSWTVTDSNVTTNIKKTITVKNISKDDNPTITAYQIVKGEYENNILTGYVPCEGLGTLTISDMEHITADEVTSIASAIRADTTSLTGITMTRGEVSGNTVDYTADVEPGLYIVIVSGSTKAIVYNPAVVAVNVPNGVNIDGGTGGEVDMTTFFYQGTDAVYLKSNEGVNIDKVIIDDEDNEVNGDATSFDGVVSFKIKDMVIPSYSQEYTSPKYIIRDTLEKTAFEGVNNLVVKVGNVTVIPSDNTYTLTCYDKDNNKTSVTLEDSKLTSSTAVSFTVDFDQAFIRENGGKAVEITYSSVLIDNAGYNFSENQNTASVEYSNDPTDEDSTTTVNDTTYSYTFGICAKIDGEDSTDKETTNEINKVYDKDGTYSTDTDTDGYTVIKNQYALEGAEFTLYNNIDFAASHAVMTSLSDKYGRVSFLGLDEGVYFLKETNPPAGYTINPTIYRIEIDAVIGTDGVLTSYSIDTYVANDDGSRNGEKVGTALYTNTAYNVEDDGSVTNDVEADDGNVPLAILDPRLAALPSTGGVGTIILTLGASIGMAIFLAIHIINKLKNGNKN